MFNIWQFNLVGTINDVFEKIAEKFGVRSIG